MSINLFLLGKKSNRPNTQKKKRKYSVANSIFHQISFYYLLRRVWPIKAKSILGCSPLWLHHKIEGK
jgi:hypothetical protein